MRICRYQVLAAVIAITFTVERCLAEAIDDASWWYLVMALWGAVGWGMVARTLWRAWRHMRRHNITEIELQ